MHRILVSACLLGARVRYNGSDAKSAWPDLDALERWQAEGRIVSFCPELAGGFPVPRPPAEIDGGEGRDVLAGTAQVVEAGGNRVTEYFVRGAQLALAEAQRLGIRVAVLKEGSPSCGVLKLYTGDFSGTLKAGRGVTTELLEQHGVRVFSEAQTGEAQRYLSQLER
jgi:uncharacterized protein YbbK (DUF523 family)